MLPTVETWRYGPSGETYLVTISGGRVEDVQGPVDPSQYAEAIAFHDKRLLADFLSEADQPQEAPVAAPVVNVVGSIRGGVARRSPRRSVNRMGAAAEPTFTTDQPSATGVPGTSLAGSDAAGARSQPGPDTTLDTSTNDLSPDNRSKLGGDSWRDASTADQPTTDEPVRTDLDPTTPPVDTEAGSSEPLSGEISSNRKP